jgi:hypothetical protein
MHQMQMKLKRCSWIASVILVFTAEAEYLDEISDFYSRLYCEATGVTPRIEWVNYDRVLSGLK